MRKSSIVLLMAMILFSVPVLAYSTFNFTIYNGPNPILSGPVVKTENLNYARAKVSYANYFDPSTDEVYFRVRNANDLSYATQYRQLNKDTFVGSQNMTVFAYLGGQGLISKSYQFAANMYTSVPSGQVQVSGQWIP